MQAMWVSLKENVNCRSKLNDVVKRQQKRSKERSYSSFGKENWQCTQLHEMGNPVPLPEPVPEVLFKLNYPRTQFYSKFLLSFTCLGASTLQIFSLIT